MTIYSINLGIGWASSGVEYAQAYRAQILRSLGMPAKFIFTNMFQSENLEHFTKNIGFEDSEIIWLYGYFTDVKIAGTTYKKEDLEATFSQHPTRKEVSTDRKLIRYYFEKQELYINASLYGENQEYVQRVEYVVKGKLIRKDYYSYTKVFSEFYAPGENGLQLCNRSFYNEDGSIAYEEILSNEKSTFVFSNKICYGLEELLEFMLEDLSLTKSDLILLDRATGIGQVVFENIGAAKLAVVIHAEHFNEKNTDEYNILWNNYYEYQFTNADKVNAFITSTERQKILLEEQFTQYTSLHPKIVAIPVGSLEQLKFPEQSRKSFSMMTGSRLAVEKHIDWLIEGVALAQKRLPELTFDIYGEGGERRKLTELLTKLHAGEFIELKGHKQLDDIYQNYELYLTASTSEGFGLTLMEAVGSGLPIIGFDVPYGNQTFVHSGDNGLLIERPKGDDRARIVQAFADSIYEYFTKFKKVDAQQYSYKIAENFKHEKLVERWKDFIEEVLYD